MKAGAEKARKRKLKTAAVVGVTCCSAGMPLLDGQRLDIVVLDECSQMVEPLSLVPMLRAGCRQDTALILGCTLISMRGHQARSVLIRAWCDRLDDQMSSRSLSASEVLNLNLIEHINGKGVKDVSGKLVTMIVVHV